MQRPASSLLRIFLVAFFCLVMTLTAVGFLVRDWRPEVASRHGVGVDLVIDYLLVTTGIVFVIGHVALAWLVWRHSGQGPATFRPVSGKTEWLWAIVPVLFMAVVAEAGVLIIGQPVWQELYIDVPEDPVVVEVAGKQFEWFVRYPGKDGKFGRTDPELVHETRNPLGLVEDNPNATDDIVTRGQLYLPVDRTATVRLRSCDVQHSFTVTAFRVKQDLVPGIVTRTQFTPTKVDEFEIACAELCGLGHYTMKGRVIVMTQEAFQEWLDGQQGWFEF